MAYLENKDKHADDIIENVHPHQNLYGYVEATPAHRHEYREVLYKDGELDNEHDWEVESGLYRRKLKRQITD